MGEHISITSAHRHTESCVFYKTQTDTYDGRYQNNNKKYIRTILKYVSAAWDQKIHASFTPTTDRRQRHQKCSDPANRTSAHKTRYFTIETAFLIIKDKLISSSKLCVQPSTSKQSSRLNRNRTAQTYKSRIHTFQQSFISIEARNLLPIEIVNMKTQTAHLYAIYVDDRLFSIFFAMPVALEKEQTVFSDKNKLINKCHNFPENKLPQYLRNETHSFRRQPRNTCKFRNRF